MYFSPVPSVHFKIFSIIFCDFKYNKKRLLKRNKETDVYKRQHDDLGIGLAEIAGNDPQDTAHDGGQRHRQEAHQQAQAPAVQAAGQDVAPLLVCSQQMAGRADALQPLRRIALKGGILGEQRRAEGCLLYTS